MTLPTVFASAARPLAHSVGRRRSLRVVDAFFGSFTALFLLLVPLSVQAAATPARFTRISVEQGLSQSTVQAILQDHRGFLWFGTEEGLNRFDGYSFVVFKHDAQEPHSLPDDKISALHEDRQGTLWVGSWSGLSTFDYHSETFSPVPEVRQKVTCIIEDPDGTLWIGTQGDGLFARDPRTGKFRHYVHFTNDPDSLSTYIVSALLRDHRGRLWIGTFNEGVDRFDETAKRFIHYHRDPKDARSLSHNEVWGLAEDRGGKLWVGTYGGGLNVFDEKIEGFQQYRHQPNNPKSLHSDLVTRVFVDHSGTLWVGTDGAGLERYEPETNQFHAFVNDPAELGSLSRNVVRTIYEDAQGQLWIGTFQGGADLLRNSRQAFAYFAHNASDQNTLSAPAVASFLEDKSGHIWIGTEGGWLDRFDPQSGEFTPYRFPSASPGGMAIMSLHQDRRGRIWAGTYRGGLARFDPERGTFAPAYLHREGDPKTIGNDEIWAIAEDDEGKLWLGTNDGMDRFDPDSGVALVHYNIVPGTLNRPGVRALSFDHQGNLWIGAIGDLVLMPRGSERFVLFTHDDRDPHSLSHSSVSAVLEDHKGRIWVGTLGGGLNLLDRKTGTFTAYAQFPSADINTLEEATDGKLWVGTDHGLSRFDPDTGTADNFDLSNGLQSLQFHLGASLKLRNGKLLFGSMAGFYNFDPAAIILDPYAPPVVFTALRISNERASLPASISTLKEVTLSPQDKIFSLEFSALDYRFPRHNRYAYKMEGFSDKWIDLDGKREVTFTNLDPGTYVFRVKASNNDGVWRAGSTAALRVVVRPPFWKTWWFRSLFLLALGSVIFSVHRMRVRRLTEDLAERTRAEQALRASEERFSKAFHANPAPMSLTRLENCALIDINQSNLNLLGYRREEVLGRNSSEIGILGFVQGDPICETLMQQGSIRDMELSVRTKSGELRAVLSSAEIIDLGGERCVLSAALDITEHKRLEEQLRQSQRIEAIGKLAGGVAHDFNNLLTVIKGYCNLLTESPQEPEPLKSLKCIDEAADRATALTKQLLAFSRRQVLQPKIFNINELLANLTGMLRRLIGEDVQIITVLAPDLGSVKADPNQIEQVIMNLVVNARDAMAKGGKLSLETSNQELDEAYARAHVGAQPGKYVLLAVSDSGTGMDAQTLAHVFEPFFTTKETGKGTGLGLSTVYGIVKQSGGHVSVYSEPDHGTTFRVYLPRAAQPAESIGVAQPPAGITRGNETILLVEDDLQVRELGRAILAAAGYSVLVGDGARSVVSLCQNHTGPIHLLLTDVVMPQVSGRELAEQVVAVRAGIKVLYMSGYTDNALFQNNAIDPTTNFLQKPFTPSSLTSKVREVLDQSRTVHKSPRA